MHYKHSPLLNLIILLRKPSKTMWRDLIVSFDLEMSRFVSGDITIRFPFTSAMLDANISSKGGGGVESSDGLTSAGACGGA